MTAILLYILVGILGFWYAKGSLARRPRLTWAIIGTGVVALAIMPWAMPLSAMTPLPWMGVAILIVGPFLGCLAAGVALTNAPIPRWLGVIILGLFILAMSWYGFIVASLSMPGTGAGL